MEEADDREGEERVAPEPAEESSSSDSPWSCCLVRLALSGVHVGPQTVHHYSLGACCDQVEHVAVQAEDRRGERLEVLPGCDGWQRYAIAYIYYSLNTLRFTASC